MAAPEKARLRLRLPSAPVDSPLRLRFPARAWKGWPSSRARQIFNRISAVFLLLLTPLQPSLNYYRRITWKEVLVATLPKSANFQYVLLKDSPIAIVACHRRERKNTTHEELGAKSKFDCGNERLRVSQIVEQLKRIRQIKVSACNPAMYHCGPMQPPDT